MGVNKYASLFPMASSCNKKTCKHRKKTWHKNMKIVFASTQLRITRLRKFPIDPKAYLGAISSIINIF